ADVDPELIELRGLRALLVVLQMARFLSDHARLDTSAGEDPDALPDEQLGIPAADAAEPEIPLVVDMADDQADLVDVPEDGHRRAARSLALGEARAQRIGADVGERLGVCPPHAGRRALVAAQPRGVEQIAEELQGLLTHRRLGYPLRPRRDGGTLGRRGR